MRKKLITSDEAIVTKVQHMQPCSDCPWARDSLSGWLGALSATEWVQVAHGEGTAECHMHPNQQCAGLAIYRHNIAKLSRDPNMLRLPADREAVFSSDAEFLEHHEVFEEEEDDGTQYPPIEQFFADPKVHNGWYNHGPMQVFVRRGRRVFDGAWHGCLDVANAVINNPKKRGKGTFKSLLAVLKAAAPPEHYVYVESVMEERIDVYLVRHGWHRRANEWPPSYYQRIEFIEP